MKNSNVGSASLYEDGDQRTTSRADIEAARKNRDNPPASSGRGSAHSKEQHARRNSKVPTEEELAKKDPLAPAMFHGNKPSRGAEIDAELQREEAEMLKQKGLKAGS